MLSNGIIDKPKTSTSTQQSRKSTERYRSEKRCFESLSNSNKTRSNANTQQPRKLIKRYGSEIIGSEML